MVNKLSEFSYGSEGLSKIPSKCGGLMLNDASGELDVVKNKKNFTVAVRVKP
jgi:hypothetical protein